MSDPSRYIWQVKYRNLPDSGKYVWETIELEEAKEKLSRAYVDVTAILSAMMDGLIAQTPFATYRAVPKNRLDTALA